MIWVLYIVLWLAFGALLTWASMYVYEANHQAGKEQITQITLADLLLAIMLSACWPLSLVILICEGWDLIKCRWHPSKIVLWRRKPPQS